MPKNQGRVDQWPGHPSSRLHNSPATPFSSNLRGNFIFGIYLGTLFLTKNQIWRCLPRNHCSHSEFRRISFTQKEVQTNLPVRIWQDRSKSTLLKVTCRYMRDVHCRSIAAFRSFGRVSRSFRSFDGRWATVIGAIPESLLINHTICALKQVNPTQRPRLQESI